MRILPVINSYNSNTKHGVNVTKFERKNDFIGNSPRTYTGEASYDLAYASMFDSAIARDLKLMGLI